MKKTILSSVSILALLALASCSTDNMPTEANGGSHQQTNFNAMSTNTTNDASVQTDTIPNTIEVTSRTADNGDIIILKDKRKIIDSAYSTQENGDIIILKDKRK